ncbi:ATP-grasp domain-containing protein [Kitasatospora sp. NBC_01560]|uniref:ATP-grasp domain-containing protein n=1 Tax=Kitasatospora sp. NBC_01560 TaxID=2975965 RepID=UPI00386E8A83
MITDSVLLLSPRVNETGLQLRTAAGRRGLRVHTAAGWRAPEELLGAAVHVYGGPLFGDAVGGAFGLALLEPPADWLTGLPPELTHRSVSLVTLAEARALRRPMFLKPPADKLFAAKVYPDGTGLPGPDALDDDTPVLASEVVRFRREYRLFVLDGEVRSASRYAVDGDLDAAPLAEDGHRAEVAAFAADVLAASAAALPSAAVIDVGLVDSGPAGGGRWAVVEANAAWASGGYACDPDAVLDVVLRSGGPAGVLAPGDGRFCRALPEVVG